MKLLAIESSSLVASVAISADDKVIACYSTDFKMNHSRTLMPMIDEIFKMTGTEIDELDAIAVSKGPGSFTGLRIGAATAKGLALSLDIPVVPVSTIAAMAYNHTGFPGRIVPVMDARRDQVYTGIYSFNNGKKNVSEDAPLSNEYEPELICVMDDTPMAIGDLMKSLNKDESEAKEKGTIFLGDGVPIFKEVIEKEADFPFISSPVNLNRQRADSVCALAFSFLKKGASVSGKDFSPDYLRPSQAERVAQEKAAE